MAAPVTRQWGKVRRLPSGRYQASYVYKGTRYTASQTYTVKSAAHGWIEAERRLILAYGWTPPETREPVTAPGSEPDTAQEPPSALTFGEWFTAWVEDHRNSKTGKPLWNFRTGGRMTSSPMGYAVDGKQYVAIGAGNMLYSFALPD